MMSSFGRMCGGHKIAALLLFIGGINWGLIGAFNYDLVNAILGGYPSVLRIVYVLVGLSALMMLMTEKCKMCMASGEKK